jgi:colanic acid/amylovoran biosynthesis glycosyltransferase
LKKSNGQAPRSLAVAHFMECYLSLTETFIYDYLCAFRSVRPVIVARRLAYPDAFDPPPAASLFVSPPRRGSAAWAAAAVKRRLRGGEPHLEKILARERVRVMHAHFGPTACGLLELKCRTGLPLVTSFYGYDATMTPVLAEYRDRYERLFELGDLFLVEGPAMKSKLEALGCPSSKLEIQRIGIRPEEYRFREREDPGDAPMTLLQCGRMVPKKGYGTALGALAAARRHDERLRLRIIGDGPERPTLEKRIRELGLEEAVTLLGARPREVFIEELERAHLYLQSSIRANDGDSEGGAPTALLEAQASGLPILATRHDDIPQVVREGHSALLSDEGDVGGLAANITRLAAEPARWGSMGRAGRAHIEARHDVRELAADLEIMYASVARGTGADDGPRERSEDAVCGR